MQITNEQYHSDTSRISKSGLDQINKSPAHYWHKYLNPNNIRNETQAMFIGTALHTAVLEPDKFDQEYFYLDDTRICDVIGGKNPRATRKYKEWLAVKSEVHAGKIRLKQSEMEVLRRVSEAVWKHRFASELLTKGIAEQTFYFEDWETNAPCKIRPDWLSDYDIICDLKSTEDASPTGFIRSVSKYRYYVQNPFYIDGMEVSQERKFSDFVFIAAEKEPPYGVGCYMLDKDSIDLGRQEYRKNLFTYMECKKTGVWPAYSQEPQILRLPNYKFYKS